MDNVSPGYYYQWKINDLQNEIKRLKASNKHLRETVKSYRNQFDKLDPWMVQNDKG